jgi:SAM-dependent methyltransferase
MLGAMCEAGELAEPPSGGVLAGDAYALPFADETFDVVIASEVLEHLVRDSAAMHELRRVLRSDGIVAVSVPRFGPEVVNWLLSRKYHDRAGGHVRIYRRRELLGRLSGAGFAVRGTEYRHGLHSPYWWLRCALGVDRPERRPVAAFHRLLVWEIERQPLLTRVLGAVLDPLIGKSLVVYLAPVEEGRW